MSVLNYLTKTDGEMTDEVAELNRNHVTSRHDHMCICNFLRGFVGLANSHQIRLFKIYEDFVEILGQRNGFNFFHRNFYMIFVIVTDAGVTSTPQSDPLYPVGQLHVPLAQ